MTALFLLNGGSRDDPAVEAWFAAHDAMRWAAQPWFEKIRACGDDVRVLMHDHCPTACVEDAAFAYVGAYAAHASVGFYNGAELADPAGLLQGSGKAMRHVKLHPGQPVNEAALGELIAAAYRDVRDRLASQ